MPLNAMLMQELEMEAQTTRRLLERVPEGRMDWRPHPRSRTLGELAMHIATVPAAVAALAAQASPRPRAGRSSVSTGCCWTC